MRPLIVIAAAVVLSVGAGGVSNPAAGIRAAQGPAAGLWAHTGRDARLGAGITHEMPVFCLSKSKDK
jgi:hypothetical protein